MTNATYQTGQVILGGAVTTPVSVTASTALTIPTALASAPVNGVSASGVLVAHVFIEGTVGTRISFTGTPTTAVGHLISVPPASGAIEIVLRGLPKIAAFKIIGTAAGALISYYFECEDDRR